MADNDKLVEVKKADGTTVMVARTPETEGLINSMREKEAAGKWANIGSTIASVPGDVASWFGQKAAGNMRNIAQGPAPVVAEQPVAVEAVAPVAVADTPPPALNPPAPAAPPREGVSQAPSAPPRALETRTTRTDTSSQVVPDKASMDIADRAQAALADNIIATGELEAENKKLEATSKAAQSEANLKFIEEEKAARQRSQNLLDERLKEIDAAQAQYSNAAIDSGKLWADMGTGNRILAAISLGLGALGAAKDGNNSAADIINKAIDRDIEVQKANINKQGQALTAQRGAYADLVAKIGDEETARLAMHNLGIDAAVKQLDAVLASNADQQVKLNAQRQKDTLLMEQANNKAKALARTKSSVEDTVTTEAAMKMPEVPLASETERKTVADLDLTIKNLDKMEKNMQEYYDEFQKGPNFAEKWLNDKAKLMGWDSVDISRLQRMENEMLTVKIKQLSGVAAGEKEVERIRDLLPLLTQNPAAFMDGIRQIRRDTIMEAKDRRQQMKNYRGLPEPVVDYSKYDDNGFEAD